MLYILNKTTQESVKQLGVLSASDDEKVLLLISDGVFLANEAQIARFDAMGIEEVFAAEDSVKARDFAIAPAVEVVDFDEMAGLFEEHDKVVML